VSPEQLERMNAERGALLAVFAAPGM